MIQKVSEKNANLLTNWFGGIVGIPQIAKGLGLVNVSLIQVNEGYSLSAQWFPEAFDMTALLSGVGIAVYGYIYGKKAKL